MNVFRDKRGYLLVETVTAMALLSITIVSLHGAMRQAALTRAHAEDFTYARFLAEELMGQLDLRPELETGSQSGEYGGRFSRFVWVYDVSRVQLEPPEMGPGGAWPGSLDPESAGEEFELPVSYLGKVRVEIHWTRLGQEFSYVVETLVSPDRLPPPEEEDIRVEF
ncbi:MAG: hypothetical protein ACLFU6_01935 [Candidatus Hydrogenedentota bacterium]